MIVTEKAIKNNKTNLWMSTSDGTIIIGRFTDSERLVGTVLKAGRYTSDEAIGTYSECWVPSVFTLYEGELSLRN